MLQKQKTFLFKKFILIITFLISWESSLAQGDQSTFDKEQTITRNLEDALLEINQLVISKQSNQAIAKSGPILDQLKLEEKYNSPIGLRARLLHGAALIHADTSEVSFDFLWKLKDDSKASKEWVVFAETCRIIASILEYSGRKAQSLGNLEEARYTIFKHKLDSIYPSFAVRISSWHRIFGDQDSSIYYAKEAVRTAPLYGNKFEEAEGYLLLGLNHKSTSTEAGKNYFKAAAKLYKEVGELTAYAGMQMNIAKLTLSENKPIEAMSHIDTLLNTILIENDNNIQLLDRAYLLKSEAFEQMNRSDSAIFYLKKGYAQQLDFLTKQNLDKVIEIDNKYNVAKKQQELEAKQAELQAGKDLRYLLTAFVFIILVFVILLAFFNLRLRTANKLKQKQADRLRQLDIAKFRFFENISHELRTPLTLVLGPINTLIQGVKSSEQQHKLLRMAQQSGKDLLQLVNKILDLQKLETGEMSIQESPTELISFFKRNASLFEPVANNREISYSYEFSIEPNLSIMLDQEKFRQILHNLLSNAFKFTPSGGQVSATLSLEKNNLNLEISDTGIGILPSDLPHIFKRFFQSSAPNQTAQGGTGIGLNLCNSYVHLLGGHLLAVSPSPKTGNGSVFTATFPILIIDKKQTEAIEIKDSNKISSGLILHKSESKIKPLEDTRPTILIVEDNSDLQAYLKLILEEKYFIISAGNGKEALEVLKTFSECKLIISDLMMPIMDGYELLEKLKTHNTTSHIPVIMLTARSEKGDRLKALRIGVDDYLVKNFDKEELLVRIENLLKNQKLRLKEYYATEKSENPKPKISQDDQKWLEEFENYVNQNLSNEILSIPMLAQEFAMSESTLLRQLKRLTGLTPVQYLKELRINKALALLESRTYNSVFQVSINVGYKDPQFFSRVFSKRFGKSPSEFLSN